ncbi:MAG: (4Fe-4S)-binding protein [Bacteroidota bacterium]|nr:(4Fe-4S)-binding protein [Bacteroidota bacterium]
MISEKVQARPELFLFKFVGNLQKEPMDKNDREYTNGDITVYWRPNKCVHATICYTQLIEVFNPRKRPWVNMQGATNEKIIEIVDKCPTDALTYCWNKDLENPPAPREKKETVTSEKPVEIQIMRDGPILVTGKIKLTDNDGKEYKTYSISSFCRCGASGNMPFCDGMHRKIGFEG